MTIMEEIQEKIANGQFEFSQHAVERSITRHISVREVSEAVMNGNLIEDYPNDKYGPSCLIYGATLAGRSLHVQCSYPSRPVLKIITVYEPDPKFWVLPNVRRN